MLNRKSPCFGCPDRKAECHSTCKKYADWRKAYEEEIQKINDWERKHFPIAHPSAGIDRAFET